MLLMREKNGRVRKTVIEIIKPSLGKDSEGDGDGDGDGGDG